MAANLVLFALVVYASARVALTEWRGEDNSPPTSREVRAEPAEKAKHLLDQRPLQSFQGVTAGNIFRTAGNGGTGKSEAPQPVIQETRLNLQLKGTVVGQESTPSCAMILDGRTRKEELYRVDEYIQGSRIESIRRDGVVLQGAKGREFLPLAEPDHKGPAGMSRTTERRQRPAVPKKAEP